MHASNISFVIEQPEGDWREKYQKAVAHEIDRLATRQKRLELCLAVAKLITNDQMTDVQQLLESDGRDMPAIYSRSTQIMADRRHAQAAPPTPVPPVKPKLAPPNAAKPAATRR
jgi:hypothetical protein